jgi:hypothetical protein
MQEQDKLISESTENVDLKKRGRKQKQANYFDVQEETAVRMFLLETSWEERNKIYNQYLRDPLDKMISSIIRRYKLYRKDMDFTEIHTDTHSFLMTKIEKFSPSKEKKAYSYFGTICKNYLMGQILKDQKEQNRKISYEDISSDLENNPNMSYYIDDEEDDKENILIKLLQNVKEKSNEFDEGTNEYKLGVALCDILENYKQIFQTSDNNKFNKNLILLSLREMTNLSTKEIRTSMKKYKILYDNIIKTEQES